MRACVFLFSLLHLLVSFSFLGFVDTRVHVMKTNLLAVTYSLMTRPRDSNGDTDALECGVCFHLLVVSPYLFVSLVRIAVVCFVCSFVLPSCDDGNPRS